MIDVRTHVPTTSRLSLRSTVTSVFDVSRLAMLIDRSVTSENNNIPRLCAGELIFSTYIEEVVPPIVSTVYTFVNIILCTVATIIVVQSIMMLHSTYHQRI